DFAAQARRVFDNLLAVLEAGDAELRNVVKATVYLTDLNNFGALNAIYAEYFGDHKPARTTVQVAGLPKGAQLEIAFIAVLCTSCRLPAAGCHTAHGQQATANSAAACR